jgi:hypothetical protein
MRDRRLKLSKAFQKQGLPDIRSVNWFLFEHTSSINVGVEIHTGELLDMLFLQGKIKGLFQSVN